MKKSNLWAAITLLVAAAMTGCAKEDAAEPVNEEPDVVVTPEEPQKPEVPATPAVDLQLTRSDMEMANESNNFAFNLFRQVSSEKSDIVSPISIVYALGMLNNGATGETQQQINKVLGFAETGAPEINTFCRKMLARTLTSDPDTKLNIANNIFFNTNKGNELNPTFLQLAKDYYDAMPEMRDFYDGLTMDAINQWASKQTEGMIKEVLNENDFNPSAVSYLLNAIYFKGAWQIKFGTEDTQEETFNTAGYGQKSQLRKVPMMHLTENLLYGENDLCQTVRLFYGNGSFAMSVLLPREGKKISDVLQTLTATNWKEQYVWGNEIAIVDVKLPRFETDTNLDLVGIMSKLGMPKAFTIEAEFPNFCNTDVYISLMKQLAKIKVSEEGTEAAAVTVIGVSESCGEEPPEPRYVTFHATRPFLYVISDEITGAILFIGQYTGL